MGLRYEIGISLDTGDSVWVHGPYLCESNPDTSIFTKGMKRTLDPSERVAADNGNFDDNCITPDTMNSPIDYDLHSKLRAGHETANKRLKQFWFSRPNFVTIYRTTLLVFMR